MRILAISGSLRRGSHNTMLLRAAGGLLAPEHELVFWDGLRDVPPYDEDSDAEQAPAPVSALREAVRAADAVLIATPEYNSSIPGQLKNALDWASRPYGISAVVGKPAGVISASTGSFGGRWAQEDVRKALRLSGAAVLGEGLAVGKAAERLAVAGEVDPEIAAGIDDVLAQLAAAVTDRYALAS